MPGSPRETGTNEQGSITGKRSCTKILQEEMLTDRHALRVAAEAALTACR